MSYVNEVDASKRTMSFGLAILLHLALGYALLTGLGQQIIRTVSTPIVAEIIQETQPRDEPPPPVPLKIPYPDIPLEPPVIPFDPLSPTPIEPTAPHQDLSPQTQDDVRPHKPAPVARVGASYDPKLLRRGDYQPAYPSQARRLNEEGIVQISVCVDANGLVDSVALKTSSGFPILDEAAVKHFQRTRIKLNPATEDGKPVRICDLVLPIRFALQQGG